MDAKTKKLNVKMHFSFVVATLKCVAIFPWNAFVSAYAHCAFHITDRPPSSLNFVVDDLFETRKGKREEKIKRNKLTCVRYVFCVWMSFNGFARNVCARECDHIHSTTAKEFQMCKCECTNWDWNAMWAVSACRVNVDWNKQMATANSFGAVKRETIFRLLLF